MPTIFITDFKSCLTGRSCRVTRTSEHNWQLDLGQGNVAQSFWTWRIVGPKRIELSDEDHGQLFGLQEPVDAEARANDLLSGAKVIDVRIDNTTSDLNIVFDNGMRFEALNMSSGYEGWTALFTSNGKKWQIVVLGGGEFAVLEA